VEVQWVPGLAVILAEILTTVGGVLGISKVGRKEPLRGASSNALSRGYVVRACKHCVPAHGVDLPWFYQDHTKKV
jgi:hypothetical protein